MKQAIIHFSKRIIGVIFFIIVLSVTTLSFAQDKTVVIPLFDNQSTAPEISFSVKRDASYDWPDTGSARTIDFSSDSTVWYNNGGAFNTSLSRFIAPSTGIYVFNGAITFQNIEVGDLIYIAIFAGGKHYYGTWKNASGNSETLHVSVTVHLNANDWAALRGNVSTSSVPGGVYGNSTTNYAFTYFMGGRIF